MGSNPTRDKFFEITCAYKDIWSAVSSLGLILILILNMSPSGDNKLNLTKHKFFEKNDLDNSTKNKTLLDSIFYWYYSKDLKDKKGDNKGIRLIKKFVFNIYKLLKETYLD